MQNSVADTQVSDDLRARRPELRLSGAVGAPLSALLTLANARSRPAQANELIETAQRARRWVERPPSDDAGSSSAGEAASDSESLEVIRLEVAAVRREAWEVPAARRRAATRRAVVTAAARKKSVELPATRDKAIGQLARRQSGGRALPSMNALQAHPCGAQPRETGVSVHASTNDGAHRCMVLRPCDVAVGKSRRIETHRRFVERSGQAGWVSFTGSHLPPRLAARRASWREIGHGSLQTASEEAAARVVLQASDELMVQPEVETENIEVTRGMAHTPCQCAVAVRVGPGQ